MENKTFTLVGKFDDQITKKLRSLNKEVEKLSKNFPKKNFASSISDGLLSANKELKSLQGGLKELNRFQFKFDKSGIQAATQEAKVLGRELRDISRAGLDIDRSGLKAAQQDAKVLGDILKANALIKVGEGLGSATAAGFSGATAILGKAGRFIAGRFNDAVRDQLEDIQARGSLFGSLNKEGLFSNAKDIKDAEKLRDINDDNYDITRNISRSMEGAIADVVKSSTVSTQTITILSRQLSDNLLPSLLKARGVTDLSQYGGVEGRKKLDEIMEGEKGAGTELARLYEQMGSITSSPAMASMTGMGFAQFLGSGSINRQLRIFETNPVLVDALRQGLAKHENTVEGRIKALKEGLEIAMPEAALMEARTTIAGGMQSISDTLTNASAGILSMGADIAGQGAKTLEMARKSGAFKRQTDIYERRYQERRERLLKEGGNLLAFEEKEKKDRERFLKGLTRLYENADSPIEVIAATFGPLMQSFADLLGSSKNLFIDPINNIMQVLQYPLVQLQANFENLASLIRSGEMSLAEALGRAFAELFKVFATLFDPGGMGDKAGGAIQKIFDDFLKGFKSAEVDGEKYMKIVMDGITKLIMSALFKGGNVLGGLTPLGDALIKVFALLAAPAFISSLISGIVPLILLFGTQFFGGLAKEGLEKVLSANLLSKAIEKFRPTKYPSSPLPKAQQLSIPLGGIKPTQLGLPLGDMTPKAAPVPKTGFGLVNFLKSFNQVGPRFLGMFKGITGKLGILGAILTTIVSLFSGESLARSLAQGAGPLLGAALGAALIPFVGPLGPLLGAAVGGWIGSLEPVVSFFEGVFTGVGQILGSVFESLASIGGTLWANFTDLWGTVTSIIPGLEGMGEEVNWVRVGMAAVKILLAPLAAALDGLDLLLLGLRSAGLRLFEWLSSLPFIGERFGNTEEISSKIKGIDARAAEKSESIRKKYSWAEMTGANLAQSAPQAPKIPVASVVPPIVPQSLGNLGSTATASTKVLQENSNQQKAHLERLKAAQSQSLIEEAKIRKTWATVNVGSQSLLMRTATSLSSAISTAAAKINSASASLRKGSSTPGGMASPAYRGFVPGSSNRKMALDEAIASEMKNKPSGSHLLIANSSETVIPAAKGFSPKSPPLQGMAGALSRYMGPLASLGSMADTLKALQESSLFLGGGAGSLGAAKALAAMFGLTMTSHFRPWSIGSYHQVGRAMDFSNSSGPTPQMMSYAQEMLKRYGSSLAELIYTPLGFSIKHGRKVPPLAAASHYDHVHVAFGLGAGNPAFFSSQADAVAWERKMMPTSARVSSVTTNSSEGFGSYTLNSPITIYQQPGQDPEELANLVATRLSMAINELRNHYA